MLRCFLHAALCVGVGIVTLVGSATGHAQMAVPNQVPSQVPSQLTPPSLRPAAPPNQPTVVLPAPSPISAPSGDSSLTVFVGDVELEGAFPELLPANEAVVSRLRNRALSVQQIYAAAAELERIYTEAGFVLARVVVPPQDLVDHGRLRLVVVDGFVEGIDVSALPERVRSVVADRMIGLVGQRHLRLAEIERSLLVAGDVPGLKLKSTLTRGGREGGVRLLLDGEHRFVSASVGGDDRLSSALSTWQLRGAVALNSALGVGEQIYATGGLGADLRAASQGRSPLAIYGAGVIVPVGVDGLTINPEYTHSTTRTPQAIGVPASLGTFERFALRLREPISLTRKASLYANFSLEDVDQQIAAPDFGTSLNHDHYAVFRAGPDFVTTLPTGAGLQLGALLSEGLGGRGALEAALSGVPLSRLGADPHFAKLSGNARISQALPGNFRLDLIGAAQSSFGRPLLRPEQIVLDGNDALSAFASGTFSADQGVMLRSELSRPFGFDALHATISPYVFGAAGRGWVANATSVEQPVFNAGAVGLGVRSNVDALANLPGGSLTLEVARGFADLSGVRRAWRANLIASAAY
jgi:hemolysin activation/secretion protein